MTEPRICLTLIVGRALRDELFDYLQQHADLVPGFTAAQAFGHGPGVRLRSPGERVKGRADRIQVQIILSEAAAETLLQRLRTDFAGTQLVYWSTPVAGFGTID